MIRERRARRWVFAVIFVASLAASTFRYPQTSDGMAILATARSLWSSGSLAIDSRFTRDDGYAPSARAGVDGRAYAKYGIGAALWHVPWLAFSDAVSRAIQASPPRVEAVVLSLIGPLLTAVAATLVSAVATLLGAGAGPAAALGLAYGLTTPAWAYAVTDHADALQAGLVALATWALATFEHTRRARALWWSGLALAAGLLVKTTLGVLAPVFAVAALLVPRDGSAGPRASLGIVLRVGVPATAAVLVWGVMNWVRFGGPLTTGYNEPVMTNPLSGGLYGLLLSFNKGLVWYAPLVVLAPAGLWRLRGRAPATALAVGLGAAVWTAVNARFYDWGGGWCWGPRYLLPVLPGMVAALAPLLGRRGGRRVAALLGLAGFTVTLLGVAISEDAYRRTTFRLWLADRTGTVPAGHAFETGRLIDYPRPAADVLPGFSSIAAHWWLARVALSGCDCRETSLDCSCRQGALETHPVFASPPWRERYPDASPEPPWGASLVQPLALRVAYRKCVFDPAAAAP